ncbi:hypothetical protein [Aureimonas sp. ME7]|uniref:hypothetical protein n=1 Tax=Aureimonas sp. ME7 TaxID=2744252 RepID=UPI0015FD10B9|nr:hypothetical protein [Aureimonas sp. ME7]
MKLLVGCGIVDFAPEVASLVGIGTSVAVGCILHKALEVPMTRMLHERYDMRRQLRLSR